MAIARFLIPIRDDAPFIRSARRNAGIGRFGNRTSKLPTLGRTPKWNAQVLGKVQLSL